LAVNGFWPEPLAATTRTCAHPSGGWVACAGAAEAIAVANAIATTHAVNLIDLWPG
jgi:hypothetical protein